MDGELAGEADGHRLGAVASQAVCVAEVHRHSVDGRHACRGGAQERLRAGVLERRQIAAAVVAVARGAQAGGKVFSAPGERRHPRAARERRRIENAKRRLDDENQADRAGRMPMSPLQGAQGRVDGLQTSDGLRLRNHEGVRRRGHGRRQVGFAPGRLQRVDAHDRRLAAEVRLAKPTRHDRAHLVLALRRHGVFQVQHQRVGVAGHGLGQHPLVAAGDEVQRTQRPHGVGRRIIIAVRRQEQTVSPR